jgi:tripartite-type tricarboxylate transporter receptor subunit TctC
MNRKQTRRSVVACAALGMAAPGQWIPGRSAHAQGLGGYPSRSIQMIIPQGAGGVSDTGGRIIARRLSEVLGQQVVVENRPGAGMLIGSTQVARAAPDGYTLLWATGSIAAGPTMMKSFTLDPLKDIHPITMVATSNNVLIGAPTLKGGTLKDLVEESRANPGKMFYGTVAPTFTLIFEYLKQITKADLGMVMYKASPAVWTDLTAGRVHAMLDGPGLTKGHVEAGRARALAVIGHKRSPVLPDVPTVAEQGYPSFGVETWVGLWAPNGVPQSTLQTIEQAMAKVVAMPETVRELQSAGLDAIRTNSQEFAQLIRKEAELWRGVAARAGIQPE